MCLHWVKPFQALISKTSFLVVIGSSLVLSLLANAAQTSVPKQLPPDKKPADAKQIFEKMEKKLIEAKTLNCSLDLAWKDSLKSMSLKGKLWLGEKDKFRLELKGKGVGGVQGEFFEVSDGKLLLIRTDKNTTTHTSGKNLGQNQRIFLARSGLFIPLTFHNNANNVDFSKDFKVSDFQLGKPEAMGGKQATVLHYKFTHNNGKTGPKVTIWLDPDSGLPLKRIWTMDLKKWDFSISITEIYSEWSVNQPIDAETFKLPAQR